MWAGQKLATSSECEIVAKRIMKEFQMSKEEKYDVL